MKKVDSVMEAAALGHMSAHSNIYGGAEGGAKNKVTSTIINRNIPVFYDESREFFFSRLTTFRTA